MYINDISLKNKYTVIDQTAAQREKTLKRKIRDKEIKLYTNYNWEIYFPTGAKYHTKTDDSFSDYNVDIKYNWTLTDYQLDALIHISTNQGGLIGLQTWWGKSHIIMATTALFKKKTLIIVPTKKLVDEMQTKFSEFTNYQIWVYFSDKKDIKDITITTHRSLNQNPELFRFGEFEVFIADEADDNVSDMFIKSLALSWAKCLVWLTWTPKRQQLPPEWLELVYWPKISVWDYQVTPDKYIQYVYYWSAEEQWMLEHDNRATKRKQIINNPNRQEKLFSRLNEIVKEKYLTLVLSDRNEDVDLLLENIKHNNIVKITWKTKIKDDNVNIKKLQAEWWVIVWALRKMYRWVDIPEIDCVVLAAPVKFENTVIQSVGRALRRHKDKKGVEIFSINDNILKTQMYNQSQTVFQEYWIWTTRFTL